MVYGPVKSHFGHRYDLPNSRHFSHLIIDTLPQFGHMNLTAFSSGLIFFPQEMHDIELSIKPSKAIFKDLIFSSVDREVSAPKL